MLGLNLNLIKATTLYKFMIVGTINTLIGFCIFSFLISFFNVSIWLANLLGLVAVMLTGFILSKIFVFHFKKKSVKTLYLYCAQFVCQYFIFTALIELLVINGWDPKVAWLIIAPLAVLFSFLIQKWLIFR